METQYISLNMTPTGVNPCFHISQYDVGRMLGFIVHSGGATVDLDTYTCTIEATRSDGTAITSAVATTDNIGTFEVTPTMSNKADKYRCQLIIVDENSKRIASLPFDMEVTKAAMDENSEAIEEDASLYQQYTEAVQGAIAEANADIQAEENARIAAVNAEATARQNADATLQNNIDAEATARQTADNTLQGNINSEASTRASADSNLQSQINQIVAPSGEAPSAAEVENARIGSDGTVYPTLGDAIRTQNSQLKSALMQEIDTDGELLGKYESVSFVPNWEQGALDQTTGEETEATNRIRTKYFCVDGASFTLKPKSGYRCIVLFFNEIGGSVVYRYGWTDAEIRLSNNAKYYRIMMYVNGKATTVPSDGVNVQVSIDNPFITIKNSISELSNVDEKVDEVIKSLPSGNVTIKNKILAELTDAYIPPNAAVIENGKLHQTHTGTGNRWWELRFNPTDAYNNMVDFEIDVESISGTGRVYLFAYNTSDVLQYISLGFIDRTGHFTYNLDFNYYAVYNNININRIASVGVANSTDEYDAVYTATNVIEPIIDTAEEEKPLNLMLQNLNEKMDSLDVTDSDLEECLVSPNGTKYYLAVENDGALQAKPVIPTGKMLMIGNSLLFGFQTFGMCASDSEHDYYWNIRKTLLPLSSGLSITRIMGTPFEESTTTAAANTWMENNLGNVLSNDYTLAVIQLGDNVNNAQRLAVFKENAVALINYIKSRCANVRVAWAGEWYFSKQKQDIIAQVCRETGSVFIDISTLVTDENKGQIGNVIHRTASSSTSYTVSSYTDDATNHKLIIEFAVDNETYRSEVPYDSYTVDGNTVTITGYYTVVTSPGVASHPGDSGMLAIANKILFMLGIINSPNEIQ